MVSVASSLQHKSAGASATQITVRNLLVIALFVLTFHLPEGFKPIETPVPSAEINSADLPRFHQVHSYFWRGAAPSFAGLDELKRLGVKTVIDLRRSQNRIDAERKYCGLIGLNYVSLPLGDFIPSSSKRSAFLNIMDDAARQKDHGPVFLHCSHGSDRTGFLTAMWRIEHDHWSILQAAGEMLEYGFIIHKLEPNQGVAK